MKKWLWLIIVSLWFLFPFGEVIEKVKAEELYTYQILYYYDSVLDESKTEIKKGNYGDLIVSFPSKKQNYTFFSSSIDAEGLTITRNVENNVIKVYYISNEKAPKTGVFIPYFTFIKGIQL
ncbi:MAG: hypothetical protein PHN72_00205 [Bacilli bacterium]|nr:hypothetical protein [Bacilli bacterium]